MPEAEKANSEEASEPHFLADPDVSEAFQRMLDEFGKETDRGAVLIAADIVSAHLETVIRALAPATFAPKDLRQMLAYPGVLASFAARADVCHLAGFVDANAYRAIGILRRIRNRAAHSQTAFELSSFEEQVRELCELGPGTANAVRQAAVDFMMRNFVENLKQAGTKLEEESGRNPFSSTAEIMEALKEYPDGMARLVERIRRMELAFGVWLLLGLVTHKRKVLVADRVVKATH